MKEVVEVDRDVDGKMTVNSPDGAPDAIRLVAVRVNVDVLVTTVVHWVPWEAAGGTSGVGEGDTRHLHADSTNLES